MYLGCHSSSCYYEKDKEDIRFSVEQDIDFIAASFKKCRMYS